jgi:hypothetical protein
MTLPYDVHQRDEETLLKILPQEHLQAISEASAIYSGTTLTSTSSSSSASSASTSSSSPLKWFGATINKPGPSGVSWSTNDNGKKLLQGPLMWLACHYIAKEKSAKLPKGRWEFAFGKYTYRYTTKDGWITQSSFLLSQQSALNIAMTQVT